MDARLRTHVRDRADGRCEYCRIHEDDDPFFTFPIDHGIAQQHGGVTTLDNLCLSCFRCNAHKGANLASVHHRAGADLEDSDTWGRVAGASERCRTRSIDAIHQAAGFGDTPRRR